MGAVSQEPSLFGRSIAENIKYGEEQATDQEVEEIAKQANALEFITKLKDGFKTDVGESGSQLSGKWQKEEGREDGKKGIQGKGKEVENIWIVALWHTGHVGLDTGQVWSPPVL